MDIQSILFFFRPYLPNILFMVFVIAFARIVLALEKYILKRIYKKFNIPRSYYLTVKGLLVFLVYFIAILLILMAIPGVDQKILAFIGIGVGVLVSLSSTTTIGNAIAGIILHITRPMREGDRVEIDGVLGDVVSLELLFVHVKTIKDEIVSIPALHVLNTKIVNYSQLDHVILHVSVSLGYDIDPGEAEEALIKAAEETECILSKPVPFVLINKLDNHSVEYEINAYTDNSHAMVQILSDLRENIIKKFTESNIQILSPLYVDTLEHLEPRKVLPEHITHFFEHEEVPIEEKEHLIKKVAEAKKKLEEKKKEDVKIEKR